MNDDKRYQWAAARFPQILAIICSSSWLLKIVDERTNTDEEARRRFRAIYPPGGHRTGMRFCPACQRIGPPGGPAGICSDCEIDRAESAFLDRLKQAWREDEHDRQERADADAEQDNKQIKDAAAELLARWWSSPLRFQGELVLLLANPWGVIDGIESPAAPLSKQENRSPIYENEAADPPVEADKHAGTRYEQRWLAVQIACHRLGISIPGARLFDPVPRSSLSMLPTAVASDIHRAAERCDRTVVDDVRRVTNAFRRACKPLDHFQIVTERARTVRYRGHRPGCRNILLRHAGHKVCLLRYFPEFPSRNVSPGTGRAPGTFLTLLSETDDALEGEIAHFQQTGRLVESVERVQSANPFDPAPDDAVSSRRRLVQRETQEQHMAARIPVGSSSVAAS